MSWSTSELRVRLAPLNRFEPSSKLFTWPFQGGTSFVELLCFCSVLCLLCLCARLFLCALWSSAGKELAFWISFVVSTVSLSLSHWYPGSGMVLDCIDSWSLHPYLLPKEVTFIHNHSNLKKENHLIRDKLFQAKNQPHEHDNGLRQVSSITIRPGLLSCD